MTTRQGGEIPVLHVVGGVSRLGGVMTFVTTLAGSPVPGVRQSIWKSRASVAAGNAPANWVCEGVARRTDASVLSDLAGAARDVPALVSWTRRNPNAVLYAHSRLGIIAAAAAAKLTNSPFLIHLHARANRPALYRRLWQSPRATVLFNSRGTCQHFGADPRTAWIMMPPISWPKQPAPEDLSGSTAHRFVAASAFFPWKNVHVIVEAFGRFGGRAGASELRLFGNAPELDGSDYQQRVVQQARLIPAVRLMGWDSTWMEQLAAPDIFVHAALNEPFGMVMLEAFARGCRLVVPPDTFLDDLPTPLNTLGIERAARLDAPALAEAMERSAKTPIPTGGYWEIRRKVSPLFSVEVHNARLAEVYHRLTTLRPSNT